MRFSSFECFLRHDKLRHKYTLLGFSRMRKNDCVLQKCVFFLPQAFCGNKNNNKKHTHNNWMKYSMMLVELPKLIVFVSFHFGCIFLIQTQRAYSCVSLYFWFGCVCVYFSFHILHNHKRKKNWKKGKTKDKIWHGSLDFVQVLCRLL